MPNTQIHVDVNLRKNQSTSAKPRVMLARTKFTSTKKRDASIPYFDRRFHQTFGGQGRRANGEPEGWRCERDRETGRRRRNRPRASTATAASCSPSPPSSSPSPDPSRPCREHLIRFPLLSSLLFGFCEMLSFPRFIPRAWAQAREQAQWACHLLSRKE